MPASESAESFRRILTGSVRMLRGERPPSWSADFARRWRASREVSDGAVETVHVAAHLSGPRKSHAMLEGINHIEEADLDA